jgi:acyl-CoA synthetase (AMP-forming)/AMP-acid ligase II
MGEHALLLALRRHADGEPGRVAIRSLLPGGREIALTRAELVSAAERFAGVLATREGPIAPIFANRSPLAVAAMLGALAAGRAFAFLHHGLRGPRLATAIAACGGPVLTDGPCGRFLAGLDLPAGSVLSLDEAPPSGPLPEPPELDEREAVVLFTSGSTGVPKGVRIAGADLASRSRSEAMLFGLGPEDVLLGLLPFSFDVGLNQLCSGLLAGAEVTLLASWLPADVAEAVGERGITGISGVPAIWGPMLDAGIGLAGDRLRYLTISGGDLDPRRLQGMPALAGQAGIYKTYGQTETFRSTCLLPEEFPERPRSVGRPFGGARVRVVDEAGIDCAPGVEGEVVHAGPGTMLGYLGSGDPAPAAVRTGDRGRLDEAGYLFLAGRADDMVKIHGLRAYPADVTAVFDRLPAIREAATVALRSADGEARFAAFFVAEPGGPDAEQVRRGLRGLLPGHLLPALVVAVDRLPRTDRGKLDRGALEAEARALLAETEGV